MTDHANSKQDEPVLGSTEPRYTIADIVMCMRISATMLELADNGKPAANCGQAGLLRAAADDLELRVNVSKSLVLQWEGEAQECERAVLDVSGDSSEAEENRLLLHEEAHTLRKCARELQLHTWRALK